MPGNTAREFSAYPSVSTIFHPEPERWSGTPSAPPVDTFSAQESPRTNRSNRGGPNVAVSFTSQANLISESTNTGPSGCNLICTSQSNQLASNMDCEVICKAGVAWGTTQVRTFEQPAHYADPASGSQQSAPCHPKRTYQGNLNRLRYMGMAICALQIGSAAAIPIATYILLMKSYERYAIEDYVHWGISLVVGAWGIMALGCLRPAALGVHVIVGTMFAAALGAHNVAEYNQLEDRCSTVQSAFKQCADCACALLNSCTAADFVTGASCPGCRAPPAEFCSRFEMERNTILLAVTGPITIFLMAIPTVFSLLALLRVTLSSGLAVSNKTAHALAAVNEQLTRLNAREDLCMPLDKLMGCIHQLEAEGGLGMIKLAAQCRAALARAGFNVGPREYDQGGKRKNPKDTSISVIASPPSFASQHSAHSVARSHQSMSAPLAPTTATAGVPSDTWRNPNSNMPRSPQPAAMQFLPSGALETSIYYGTPHPPPV